MHDITQFIHQNHQYMYYYARTYKNMQEQSWIMSMMHESNVITCFSWITNLIPSKPPLKQFPTWSSRIRTKERREGTMREKVERERTCREREDVHLRVWEKTKVTSPPILMSLYNLHTFPSSKVTLNSPKTLI